MTEITDMRHGQLASKRYYRVSGNILDLIVSGYGKGKVQRMVKRLFVSPEFMQLFFKIQDKEFDDEIFERLTDKERQELSYVMSFLGYQSRGFTIAIAKMNRGMFSRLKLIEGAIKAGNLSEDLRDEYGDIMKSMGELGMIPKITATKQTKAMVRTFDAMKRKNAEINSKKK